MKPYTSLPACNGASCNQGRSPCKTEALCNTSLHRVNLPTARDSAEIVDREYDQITMEDDVSLYGKGAGWFALCLVALIAAVVWIDSIASAVWPQLVAMLSFGWLS